MGPCLGSDQPWSRQRSEVFRLAALQNEWFQLCMPLFQARYPVADLLQARYPVADLHLWPVSKRLMQCPCLISPQHDEAHLPRVLAMAVAAYLVTLQGRRVGIFQMSCPVPQHDVGRDGAQCVVDVLNAVERVVTGDPLS